MSHRKQEHLEILDILRGIAILMVFSHHVMFWSHGFTKIGWNSWHRDISQCLDWLAFLPITLGHFGVAIFFVVSGFCIHLSHSTSIQKDCPTIGGSGKLSKFFVRRFWRIYPPFVTAFILFLIGDILNKQISSGSDITFQAFTHLLLIHNLFESTHYGVNPSFWSISIEAQLYLIYPILFLATKKFGWLTSISLTFTIELTLRLLTLTSFFPSEDPYRVFTNGPFNYWFSWSIGSFLGECHLRQSGLEFIRSRFFLFLAVVLAAATWFLRPLEVFEFPSAALLTAWFLAYKLSKPGVAPLSHSNPSGKFLTRTLCFFGTISYSFYLLHQPLISLSNSFFVNLGAPVGAASAFGLLFLSIIPITLVSWLFYIGIEIPFNKLGKALARP